MKFGYIRRECLFGEYRPYFKERMVFDELQVSREGIEMPGLMRSRPGITHRGVDPGEIEGAYRGNPGLSFPPGRGDPCVRMDFDSGRGGGVWL